MDEDFKKNVVKTGTTIVGIVCKDGIVMAGDNRATLGGQLIINKEMNKVMPLNDYLVLSICGNATEGVKISKILTAELKLKQLKTKKRPSIREAASLLSNIQAMGSAFILAGVDIDGKTSLYEVIGNLQVDIKDYTASVGSGMPYVLGYLERSWKPNLTLEQGVELAKESLKASMERDPASGNGVDIFTINKEGIKKVATQRVEPVFRDQ